MSDADTLDRPITVDMVHNALNLVTYYEPDTVEDLEPACDWPRLCTQEACVFPRYFRGDGPVGLTANVLMRLGYPTALLKDLDAEYELGEVLHPGVKIGRSRNVALHRIDRRGVALLSFLQEHQKIGWSWAEIGLQAFRPRRMIRFLDARRRPWLY